MRRNKYILYKICFIYLTVRLRVQVFHEQIVNEAWLSSPSLIENESEYSNNIVQVSSTFRKIALDARSFAHNASVLQAFVVSLIFLTS